jgi:hypothetical protein
MAEFPEKYVFQNLKLVKINSLKQHKKKKLCHFSRFLSTHMTLNIIWIPDDTYICCASEDDDYYVDSS